jgi:glycosyltransferase involved in cell wall biosynthesis
MDFDGVSAPDTPDVTVVVAVYNTMPYLTACLNSLVEQTIGRDRMQIVAVDDGSTDDSGAELDRFARCYPDTVKVIHQANSGGPAAPSNRALEHATGRYVFFVGADDYLGPEALERLVRAADTHGADVTLGRLVGVNGRYVHQAVYASSEVDIGVFDSALPWSMSNTKLFRRDLIERFGLRFPEDMPMLSDQPFTIEACVRASRISVLADYEYYYAVRRLDASNITFVPRHEELLRCTARLMDFVAELVEPGKQRDALHLRHFSWEVAKLLRSDLLLLDRAVQQRIHAGVRRLTGLYLTDNIRDQLRVNRRVLLCLADRGNLDDLLEFVRQDAGRTEDPPVLADGERWYARYPGFRDARLALPDDWFDVTATAAEWIAKMEATSVAWGVTGNGRQALTVTARSPLPDLGTTLAEPVGISAGELAGTMLEPVSDGAGTTVRAVFAVDRLLAAHAEGRDVRLVKALVSAFGKTGSAPLRAVGMRAVRRLICRRGARFYSINPAKNHSGRLVIAVTPITLRHVVRRLRRKLFRGGRR